MIVRAVLCDIYNTLLEVGPPPTDAEARWAQLCAAHRAGPRLSLEEFASASEQLIAREHAVARARGIAFPEIYWPHVAVGVLPELRQLSPAALDDFLFAHAQLQRTLGLLPDAAETLFALAQAGVLLGLVSNCQPYTLRELDLELARAGLRRDLFRPALCFFSFQAGFSKPDPHVFRWSAARLRAFDIPPTEALMVGDRLDNDLEPARMQGFQAWHLASQPDQTHGGRWPELLKHLRSQEVSRLSADLPLPHERL
ncbi:MAG: HAD family hydrolase [Verrucomicrobia bacterium]|nr:HAD family hydrolase [Verrucomicrobiota bacterium]